VNHGVARRIVADLARQDRKNGDLGPAVEQVIRWRQAGREAGDVVLVEAIDTLGDEAVEVYESLR
jgi:hypothetical protein